VSAAVRSLRIAVAAGLCAGCVTVYEDVPVPAGGKLANPEFAVVQVIPIGDGAQTPEGRLLAEVYTGVLRRMHEAARANDAAGLQSLLDAYDRPNLPSWIADRVTGFRALGRALHFLAHAEAHAEIRLVPGVDGGPPPIGARAEFEFVLPAGADPARLGGADPTCLLITIAVADDFVDGGSRSQTDNDLHRIAAVCELRGEAVLRLPLRIEVPAGGAVRRRLHLRVALMPGYLEVGGQRAPVPQRTLARAAWTQWPAGFEPIAARPLATLREALRLGDEAHFAHVYLGAMFTAGADRAAAIGLLIDQVRLGQGALATVAMAALRAITTADIQVGDRERWLAWYDQRR
jgi:hypothetical protein